MVSPFDNSFQIDMYNYKLFGTLSKGSIILNDTPSDSIYYVSFKPHNDMPTAKYLFNYLGLDIKIIYKSTTLPLAINHS